MKKLIYIILLFFLQNIYAQEANNIVSDEIVRKINLKLVQNLQNYEQASEIKDKYDFRDFRPYFKPESKLFNDILPDNNMDKSLILEDYLNLHFQTYTEGAPSVELELEKIGIISKIGDTYSVNAYAKKIIEYTDFRKLVYLDTLDIVLNFIVSQDVSTFYIKEILPAKKYGKYLFLTFNEKSFLRKPKPINTSVNIKINETDTVINSGYILLKRVFPQDNFHVQFNSSLFSGNRDVKFNRRDNETITFYKTLFYVNPVFENSIGSFLMISPDSTSSEFKHSNFKRNSLGINLGYLFFEKKNVYFNLGVHQSKNQFESYVNNYQEQYSDIDPDGAVYLRTNQLSNVVEQNSISTLTFTSGISQFYNFTKSIFTNYSVNLCYNIIKEAQFTSTAEANYSGYYADFFGITMTENAYDFGGYNISENGSSSTVPNFLGMSLNAGVGLSLSKRYLFQIGLSYSRSFGSIYTPNLTQLSSEEHELNSLLNFVEQAKMNSLNLNFGIYYKF